MLIAACDNRKKQFANEADINPRVEELDETPDEAKLVRLLEKGSDSITVKDVDSQEELRFSIAEAGMKNKIKGTLHEGDLYSIFPDSNTKRVKIVINVTELLGKWFFDMQNHRGFTLDQRGGMSSINGEDICFRQWKLLNGEFYLYYLDMEMVAPDRHEFLVEPAEIISLNKDCLQFRFLGKVYDCRRQKGLIMMNEK